ncbi:ABC transporter substrate binding protein [Orenia marismortui]|uniref:histidine kinase n=1 Tax=Orenia marismortui TaxID=46469 RepID=A0A4R8H0D9_9FIRM|nr:ABC transporter substrate binding protein [Orenia marismortui]TDX52882.1 PAS domain S-box-containing protein [Orenia marismortui]
MLIFNKKFMIMLVLMTLVIIIIAAEFLYAQPSGRKDILILNSYHKGYFWSDNIVEGIEDFFSKDKKKFIAVEYMDSYNHNYSRYSADLYNFYKLKYKGKSFDVIISCDDAAFNFLQEYGDELFPNVPIVFCGVNSLEESWLKENQLFTGVIGKPDLRKTVDLILNLHSQTEEIVIFVDETETGRSNQKELLKFISSYDKNIKFTIYKERRVLKLRDMIRGFSDNSVVLLMSILTDEQGLFMPQFKAVKLISKNQHIPIYSNWDVHLKYGVIGGFMISSYEQGQISSKMAEEILRGKNVKEIPVQTQITHYPMFDFKQLKKFDISTSQLPEASIIINRPESFYFKYRKMVWITVFILFLLLTIIITLKINIFKRKKAEKDLLAIKNNLEQKIKGRTDDLKREKEKLQKYLNVAEVIFVVLDNEGKIQMINRKGLETLECTEEEVLGKHLIDNFVKEESKEELLQAFEALMKGEKVPYTESIAITKTGKEKHFLGRNTILRDKEGNIEGALASVIDITKQKLLKEELEYNKFKLELFANLSHELKTPLNLSFSSLQMLNLYTNKLNPKVEDKIKSYTKVIKQNNYRLLKLVNNLMDITKITSNSFQLKLKNYDIVKIVKKLSYSIQDCVESHNKSLEFDSSLDAKVIACDPFNIERILLNLLSNAIKFTKQGDKIIVSIFEKDEKVFISVEDTGIGIPEDRQEVIFERFRQVDKSFHRNSEGSGLGLSIVKLLVELHGGKISLESKAGKGSKFIIELPIELVDESQQLEEQFSKAEDLMNKIDIEFSDIYDL